jgi:hypothetical protein
LLILDRRMPLEKSSIRTNILIALHKEAHEQVATKTEVEPSFSFFLSFMYISVVLCYKSPPSWRPLFPPKEKGGMY